MPCLGASGARAQRGQTGRSCTLTTPRLWSSPGPRFPDPGGSRWRVGGTDSSRSPGARCWTAVVIMRRIKLLPVIEDLPGALLTLTTTPLVLWHYCSYFTDAKTSPESVSSHAHHLSPHPHTLRKVARLEFRPTLSKF